MAHVSRNKKKLLARVRRIEGQVVALGKALGADTDCVDVLVQIAAVRGAVHGLMMEVLNDHLDAHVVAEPDAQLRAREMEIVARLLRAYAK